MTAPARRLIGLAALVAGAILLVVAARRIDRAVGAHFPADLVVDHRAANAFLDGYTPFSVAGARRAGLAELGPTGIGHPPTTSLWLLPLARVRLETAARVLAWLSLATLIAEMVIAAALLELPLGLALLGAGFVALAPFYVYLSWLGQVSQLIAFAYFVAWWALRRGREVTAGVALGAACTMKLFPAVLVLWLAITRRWRALIAAAAVYVAAALVMTARFGLASWGVFFRAQREVANAWVANVANQSLHGVVQRLWASPACELPGPVAPEALALSVLLSIALLALAARRARASLDLSFAAFAVLSVLTSQWAWPHYDVLFVLPAMIVAATLPAHDRRGRTLIVVMLAGLALSWGIDVRAATVLQTALWAGDRRAHLPLHLVEVLSWLPSVLLFGVLQLARSRPLAPQRP